jgi:hypothetical protein
VRGWVGAMGRNEGAASGTGDDGGDNASVQLTLDDSWEVDQIDPRTGEMLPEEERGYRGRIRSEAARGLVAVDPLYHAHAQEIHQPILDERGALVDDDAWELKRRNKTMLRVSFRSIGNGDVGVVEPEDQRGQRLEDLGVTIARKAIGEVAADLMGLLYRKANDPPHWRNREIRTTLSELMDDLGYGRDDRGVHRSGNRRTLSQTLLALQFTQVGVQRDEDGVSVGTIGSLISGMEYRTRVPVSDLSPIEVFAQGLPEDIAITLNAQWYRVRDAAGRPLEGYALVPRDAPPLLAAGGRKGRHLTPYHRLSAYLDAARARAVSGAIRLTRAALLDQSGITDTRRRQATGTLTKALDRLCAEGLLLDYAPRPLPLDANDLVSLTLPI